MVDQLKTVFKPRQATVLAEVITAAYNTLVKASDLAELKGVVRDLAQAQQSAEARLSRVEAAVERLAEAQQHSEVRLSRVEAAVERLAEAQQRTEQQVQRLAQVVEGTNRELGGLSRSMSYALDLRRSVPRLASLAARAAWDRSGRADRARRSRWERDQRLRARQAEWPAGADRR